MMALAARSGLLPLRAGARHCWLVMASFGLQRVSVWRPWALTLHHLGESANYLHNSWRIGPWPQPGRLLDRSWANVFGRKACYERWLTGPRR